MIKLLKYWVILKLLNPFQRGFSVFRFLLCLVILGGLGLVYGVPDWATSLVRQAVMGKADEPRQQPGYAGGGYANAGFDEVMRREVIESRPKSGAASDGGGLLADILGKGSQAIEDILSGSVSKERQTTETPGYGPPAGFSGGTVAANPRLFAEFAKHGTTPAQLRSFPDSPAPVVRKPEAAMWVRITSVVDGDTLKIGRDTVRLIGIDAPEAVENEHLARELGRIDGRGQEGSMLHMGRTAADFARRLAEGKRCWLEFDGGERDQFGRVLAYVHLEDGTNLNEAMLYEGYAKVYLGGNFRYLKRFLFLQDEAERRGSGLWRQR